MFYLNINSSVIKENSRTNQNVKNPKAVGSETRPSLLLLSDMNVSFHLFFPGVQQEVEGGLESETKWTVHQRQCGAGPVTILSREHT